MRDKCRNCLEPGHMARNCPNPPRAWEVVNHGPNTGGVSSVSSDPTPAEAHKLLAVAVPRGSDLLLLLCCQVSALAWFLGVLIGVSRWIASRWI